MFASITSAALVGVAASAVRVEAHVSGRGKESFSIVGLPDPAVREARERVRSAVLASGFPFPSSRVTVNLAPADLPKVGSAYDLPIALGLLAADRRIPETACRVVALGELALDGAVRGRRGSLAAGMVARRRSLPCIVAAEAAAEAMLAAPDVVGVDSLAVAIAAVAGNRPTAIVQMPPHSGTSLPDLSMVRGQRLARLGIEVAAAGGHHLLLRGAPGAGKTLLARCLPSVLPDLTDDERLEVAQAHAAAGRPPVLSSRPPFRSPHHSATPAAILGGGSGVPVPGELTLADRGVLFLDELAEFPAHVLDSLRQPFEEGAVHVARKGASVSFPARVQLVAATNPCPCGWLGDEREPCRCPPSAVERYQRRLSGPLLDRFDLRIDVGRVSATELAGPSGESSHQVRDRVEMARRRQSVRGVLNRDLDRAALDDLAWSGAAVRCLGDALRSGSLTARGWDRVRRVARTLADLADRDEIGRDEVETAMRLRM